MAEQKPAPNASMPSIHSFGTCLRKLRLYIEAKRPDESRQLARKFVSTIGLSEQVGDALFAFAGQAPLRSYAADSQIFVEGSPGQEVYLVLQGTVRIQRVGQGELERVEAGEFFGEFEALAQTNRSASAIAQTNVHTLRLPKPAIDQLSRFIPQITQWFKNNMRERILAQLSQPNSLFEELNYDDRLSLLNALSFRSANQGDAIIEEGDPPSGLRIVYSGWLDVWRKSPEGVDRCVATLGPGDIFGESSLLLARQCNATVRCSTPVTYLELNPLSFYQAIPSVVGLREKLIALIHRRQQGYNPEGAIEASRQSPELNALEQQRCSPLRPKLRMAERSQLGCFQNAFRAAERGHGQSAIRGIGAVELADHLFIGSLAKGADDAGPRIFRIGAVQFAGFLFIGSIAKGADDAEPCRRSMDSGDSAARSANERIPAGADDAHASKHGIASAGHTSGFAIGPDAAIHAPAAFSSGANAAIHAATDAAHAADAAILSAAAFASGPNAAIPAAAGVSIGANAAIRAAAHAAYGSMAHLQSGVAFAIDAHAAIRAAASGPIDDHQHGASGVAVSDAAEWADAAERAMERGAAFTDAPEHGLLRAGECRKRPAQIPFTSERNGQRRGIRIEPNLVPGQSLSQMWFQRRRIHLFGLWRLFR